MIVADASAVVDLLLAEDGVRAEIHDRLLAGAPVEAPDLLTIEVVAAVTRVVRAGRLSRSDVDEILAAYLLLPIETHPMRPYCLRIAALAARHSVYDAAYVALAEGLDAPLLTSDARLARSVTGVDVIVV